MSIHESAHAPGPTAPFLRLVEAMVGTGHVDTAADEQSYRRFIEAIGVAVYTTDAKGRITFFNDAAATLWGRRPELGEEWCGSWRLFWPNGDAMAHSECPMAIALNENRPVRGMEARALRPDGSYVDFEPLPTPLRDSHGDLIGAVNVLIDITDRRRAEEEMRATAEALGVSNAVKDDFLGLVSHELRTPVTTIYGNAQLLHDRMERLSATERAEMADDIAEDADRLLAIVENLLLLSRLQAGVRPDVEPLLLSRAVEAQTSAFRRRHPEAPVHIEDTTSSAAIVEADGAYVMIVLENLLSNARKYAAGDHEIDVAIDITATEATVRVMDRGVGIDGLDPEELFTPFFRAPAAQRLAGGVGLGLPVCRRIVTLLGGRIWAAPRPGGGAEFGFSLPRLDPDRTAEPT